MTPLFGSHTKTTIVIGLRGCSVELQGSSKVVIHNTLVFLICLMRWGGRLFLKGDMRLDLFCFRQIDHTTSQYEQSFSHKTSSAWNGLTFAEAPSLAVFRSNFV